MRPLSLLLSLLFPILLSAQSFDNGFNFYLPHDDSTTQRFLPKFPKKAADSYVTVGPDGMFMADGQPIRFWGMSMAYGACFPDKDDAPIIAARLRKMGVNLVRFTLMDAPWAGEDESIFFGDDITQVLNPFNLDKLHFFIAQLKNEGIYSNLVLHHNRRFKEDDGVLYADSMNTSRAVNMFDGHLIKLQKDHALYLLTPPNPYTDLSLAEDPAVAMIDISNHNTLYGYWKSDWLRHNSQGGVLIQRHIDTLDLHWNEFLQNKYTSQTDLENVWNQTAGTGGQNEQVTDGGFESGDPAANYIMELHDVAQATITADTDNPFEGNYSGRVDVLNVTNTNWHVQFKQIGATLAALKTYQITFAARAEDNRDIIVVASRDNAPWNGYGSKTISLSTDWQEYTFTFTADEDNDANFRLGFQFNGQVGSYWFDNLSMTDADIPGVLPGESLADGNIRRMDYSERFDYSPHRMADNTEFYLTLQTRFFDEMYAYLKDDLGVQGNITASNTWSGISDIYTARNMDYVSDQSSWDYIRYPNGWSTSDWYIENEPMVKSGGWTVIEPMFGGVAMKDKPYIISSYDQPFPHRYQTEMMPWMTAYGSFHNANAINFYYYNDEGDSWTADIVDDYYSLHRNIAQMVLSPAYSYAYRHGLLATANQTFELEYSLPYLRALPFSDFHGRWGKYIPYNSRLAYTYGLRIAGFGGTGAPDIGQLPTAQGSVATTDNNETVIDFDQGVLKSVTPEFVSVCGFMDEQTVDAGALKVNSSNGFGVVAWLSLTGEPLGHSNESLLSISSQLQNTNMMWNGLNTINDNWGSAPTEMFPLNLELELELDADYLYVFPLSAIGEVGEPKVVLPSNDGQFLLNIDQSEDETTWYGIEAGMGTPTEELLQGSISVYPNPSTEVVFVKWPEAMAIEQVTLVAADGKAMGAWKMDRMTNLRVEIGHLPKGVYFLKMKNRDGVYLEKLIVQ